MAETHILTSPDLLVNVAAFDVLCVQSYQSDGTTTKWRVCGFVGGMDNPSRHWIIRDNLASQAVAQALLASIAQKTGAVKL